MRNYTPLLKERWDKGWPAFKEYYTFNHEDSPPFKGFTVTLKEEYGGRKQSDYPDIYENVVVNYEPVPEEVACMALKMLSEEKEAFKQIGEYTISRRFKVDYQYNLNELDVSFRGEYVIYLAWANGENVQNVYDEDEEGRLRSIDVIHGKHNIFKISGYYEARNFCFNWHKE